MSKIHFDRSNPSTLIKLKSGFACLHNSQFLPGSCILIADPQVPSINDLSAADRQQFLLDMSLVGDAILEVCQARRINYGIMGNSWPVLHAHIIARYDWEPEDMRPRNPWVYPDIDWDDPDKQFDADRDAELKEKLGAVLRTFA